MDAIDLQKPELLPEDFKTRLNAIKSICRNEEFSEELVKHPKVRKIVIELDDYCMQRRVLGIHYTRAIRGDIEKKGLLVRTGAEIRDDFIRRFGHKFEADELAWFQKKWTSHQARQSEFRDSMLWFNFTLKAYEGSGSEDLLGKYGGEQIHMGIDFDSSIGKKLANIGESLIVKCALDPQKVQTFIEHPWGKILVSSFHLGVEPEAFRIDQDGFIRESILPQNIIIEAIEGVNNYI